MFRRSIKIEVENKVFSADDIMQLAELLYSAFSTSRSGTKRVSFVLALSDGSNYELQDEKPAQLRQILTTRKVNKIDFKFYDFGKETHVNANLTDDGSPWARSDVIITAKGDAALNSLKSQVEDLLSNVKPQANLYLRYRTLLKHLSRLYLGALTIELIFVVVAHLGIRPTQHPSQRLIDIGNFIHDYRVLILPVLAYIQGGYWQLLLFGYLDKLWPSVEFDFGPEHLRGAKVQRKYVGYVMTAIMIPIVLQLLFIHI